MPGILQKIKAGNQLSNSLTCPVCGLQGFGSQRGVSQHMKAMHPKALKSMEDGYSVPSDELRVELQKFGDRFDRLERQLSHFMDGAEYRISGLEKDVGPFVYSEAMREILRQEKSKKRVK